MTPRSRGSRSQYSGRTLRFVNIAVEGAFVKSRYEKLCRSSFFGLLMVCIFAAVSMAASFTSERWLWSASSEGTTIFRVRMCLMGTIIFMALPLMILMKRSLSTSCLRGEHVEALLSVTACFVSMLLVAQHPWYIAKALSIDDPYMALLSDDKLLLHLDVWLTGLHLVLPMRWTFLTLISLTCFAAYSIPPLVLGSQMGSFIALNALILLMLIVASTWGKRSLEMLERTTFTQIAQERTLRYEVEHQLSAMTPAKVRQGDLDASSVGTSQVFNLRGTGSLDEQLEEIIKCGSKEHWLIEPEALRPIDDGFISNGGFGMVMLAYYHGVEVALKVPRVTRDVHTLSTLKSMAVELRIFRYLHHPHIVAFHGACIDICSRSIVLVLEYVRGTPLSTASTCVPNTPEALSERLLWADNLCSALVYLHAQKPSIVHGDIKDSNVIVEQGGGRRIAKLLDFGLSKLLKGQDARMGGTVSWMAPEVILRDKKSASTKVDVFSFGRLLYKIMTGRAPYTTMTAAEIKDWARRGSIPPLQWPRSMPLLNECRNLCGECLSWTALARPDMIDVQATLREWCWRDDIQDDVGASICRAFPQRLSSENLLTILERIKEESAISSSAAPCLDRQPQAQDPQRPQVQESAIKARHSGGFTETSLHSRKMSITMAILKWNVPLDESCCNWHARLRALHEVSEAMRTNACVNTPSMYAFQCQACGFLNEGVCEFCSGTGKSLESSSQEQPQLASIKEALDTRNGSHDQRGRTSI
eukprot:TRINITY_DN8888_c0_g2_i1.p1 TRINITY_DN8888_c0_g2~~TRINITY_DN8888_c0_g2_i1.p1  ORF type:complete len:758 (-),score=35.28 TRINITY_DN8888_c0_g2_i1:187-2460(-)